MTGENAKQDTSPFTLTEDEEVTLRRVAFGESELRSLRRADIERLLALRLIVACRDGMGLTRYGRTHFESLRRATFARNLPRRG